MTRRLEDLLAIYSIDTVAGFSCNRSTRVGSRWRVNVVEGIRLSAVEENVHETIEVGGAAVAAVAVGEGGGDDVLPDWIDPDGALILQRQVTRILLQSHPFFSAMTQILLMPPC